MKFTSPDEARALAEMMAGALSAPAPSAAALNSERRLSPFFRLSSRMRVPWFRSVARSPGKAGALSSAHAACALSGCKVPKPRCSMIDCRRPGCRTHAGVGRSPAAGFKLLDMKTRLQSLFFRLVRLDEAQVGVEGQVFGHQLVRVESYCLKTRVPRRLLGESDEPTAVTAALSRRPKRDIVEQHGVGLGDEHDETLYATVTCQDEDTFLADQKPVIVEHRSGLSADARDVVAVGCRDQFFDGCAFLWNRKPDLHRGSALPRPRPDQADPSCCDPATCLRASSC